MATVNAQALVAAGLNPTMSAASGGGDTVDTGPNVFLIVNSGSTTANLTITTPNTDPYGNAIADRVIAVAANAGTVATAPPLVIPLPTGAYGDANAQAALAWSATTNIKFAVVRM